MDATATPFGAWASIRGYFTPATLFLFVNLVIGTIALTSRASQNRRRRDYYQYDGDGHHHHQDPHQQQQGYHYYGHHEQEAQYVTPPAPAPAPLARTSSVLDRLRSIGLYRFRSGDFPPEYGTATAGANHTHDVFPPVEEETTKQAQAHYARSQSEPAPAREEKRPAATRVKKSGSEVRKAQVVRAPARVVEAVVEDEAVDARAEEFIGSFRREPPPQRAEHHYQEEYVPPVRPAPASLARTSSVLDRLRSLDIYGFLAPAQAAAAPAPARDAAFATPADEKQQQAAHYGRSRSEPKWEQGKEKKKQLGADGARMAKSSSVARKQPAGPSLVAAAADDCVDARAEAFIDSFRREYVAPTPTPPKQQAHHDEEDHVVPPPAPPPLARTPSVMERLRSFGLYRFRSGDLGPEIPAAADSTPAADDKAQAHYDRSRSEPAKKEKKQGAEARMSKSSSESIVEEPETEACVDERADDFINKFRQQLQLQRLNSLLNYKEMLNRGGGKQ